MSRNDRMLLLVIPVIAAVIAFWFLVLSPKQNRASKLDSQVSKLESDVSTQQQAAQAGQQARQRFPRDYHRLVVMGKAVPVDDETASLLVQLNRIAARSGASFRKIDISQGSSSATTAAPATTTAAPATESSAALLPIGATVGSAGLPTMPYSVTVRGDYFQIADFMAGVDRLVQTGKGKVEADGRLATIDGFALAPPSTGSSSVLTGTLAITTYVTPAGQGLTAGATPTSPGTVPSTPASSTTPTSAPATP
jgi:Tfp pilus assembly protein PilO